MDQFSVSLDLRETLLVFNLLKRSHHQPGSAEQDLQERLGSSLRSFAASNKQEGEQGEQEKVEREEEKEKWEEEGEREKEKEKEKEQGEKGEEQEQEKEKEKEKEKEQGEKGEEQEQEKEQKEREGGEEEQEVESEEETFPAERNILKRRLHTGHDQPRKKPKKPDADSRGCKDTVEPSSAMERRRKRNVMRLSESNEGHKEHGDGEEEAKEDVRYVERPFPEPPRRDTEDLLQAKFLMMSLTSSKQVIIEEGAKERFITHISQMSKGENWRNGIVLDLDSHELHSLATRCQVADAMEGFAGFQVILSELFLFLKISRSTPEVNGSTAKQSG
ncbi:hypothetical protein VKT23_020532 [Stygiomarasmius scandens]|uniref:Uncharacterized protein n=1 Tax=Marasmiellus scandens TaxID=2682957 RepID=A0ABR1IIU3_9AGAR